MRRPDGSRMSKALVSIGAFAAIMDRTRLGRPQALVRPRTRGGRAASRNVKPCASDYGTAKLHEHLGVNAKRLRRH